MNHADDLRSWTLTWSRQWWDPEQRLLVNPPGSFDELAPPGSLHLVPNTAWFAYGLLGSDEPDDHRMSVDAISRLMDLQYGEPGTEYHGTFARFGEWPHPPAHPAMWEDYDPNWRQFVGTTFALMLEDFGPRLAKLDAALVDRMVRAIELACRGEPEARIPVSYSNPALMRAWLDAWFGRRAGDPALLARGVAFARAIAAEFDRFDAFDEFNSPTYYGIDLYALALWRTFPPTEVFATEGARLEAAVWRAAGDWYHAGLRNWCGPFTRSYGPDATRTLAKLGLWVWAVCGRSVAPLPDLDAASIDHGHDLMAGPVIARLAQRPDDDVCQRFASFGSRRTLSQDLAHGRHIESVLHNDLMLGAESSHHDWGGWSQFMPAVAHWREPDGSTGVLWLDVPRKVRATVDDRTLRIEVEAPGATEPRIELLVQSTRCETSGTTLTMNGTTVALAGALVVGPVKPAGEDRWRVSIEAAEHDQPVRLSLMCGLSGS